MEGSDQISQKFHFEEAFAEMMRDEGTGEVFTGRQEYRDQVTEYFSSQPLFQQLNNAFDEVYKFESAVGDFIDYFKQGFDEEKRAGGAS